MGYPRDKDSKINPETEVPNKLILTLKVLFFFVCLTGFSYQATEFLRFYFTYPSVIELRTETLKKIQVPALTYCYVNGIARNKFCSMFPEACYNLSKGDEDCAEFPLYCEQSAKVPIWKNFTNITDMYLNNFVNSNDNFTDFLGETTWEAPKEEREGPFFYATWWSLDIITCYTLHSRVNSNKDPFEVKFDYPGVVAPSLKNYIGYINFDLENETVFDPKTTAGVAIAVHSPFTSTYPDMKNLLKPGNRYEIEIIMKEEHLLPYPYKTDCMNYTSLWEKNNRSGPRSKKMCQDLCGVHVDVDCFGCVEAWNLYPHSHIRCIRNLNRGSKDPCNSTVLKEFDDCKSRCKRECSITKYTYSISKLVKDPWDSRGYSRGKIEMDIYMDLDILILTHSPRYQNVELFSNVGGYIGIWLGISLFAVTDLIKSVVVTIKQYIHHYGLKLKNRKIVC